ncbi:MAG: hypothetical protein IPP94_04320 [Ignavibacteria bacterium]|nr:hypothetical protein [Ignavibacteria bacterium]
MKRLLLLGLLFLAGTGIVLAQGIPQSMSYQGYVTDLTGTPVADGNYNFTFTLWTSDVAGASVWTENHTNVQVSKGLFTVQLGRGNPAMPLTIAFDQQLYLGIRIGADPELTPRVRLATSAYTFRAKMAENVIPQLIMDSHVNPTANIAASKLQSTVLTESEIVAGSGVTVNNAGGTLTISASGGAVTLGGDVTGPAGSNTIANLAVTTAKLADNAVTTAKIADNAVTTAKIADNAVTAAKISPNIVSSLDGVSNDGGDIDLVAGANITLTPNDAANTITIAASGGGGGLTLPFTGNASSASSAFDVEQTGTGKAGWFHVNNAASTADALNAHNNSTSTSSTAVRAQAAGGRAIEAYNSSGSMPALYVYNLGVGPVAQFGNSSSSTGNIVEITKNGGAGKGLSISYTGTSNAVYIDNNSTGTGLELRQDGAGKAAYFHIENTTSAENALFAETKSTNVLSDAIQATANDGRAINATSTATGKYTIYSENSGGSGAIWAAASTTAYPTLRVDNDNTTANAKVMQGFSSLGSIFVVDREGDVDAEGGMTADVFTARNSWISGEPTTGRVYTNNIVYAWGRVTAAGSATGNSFGIASVTRNTGDSSYTVVFNKSFVSQDDYAVAVTPVVAGNFEVAGVNNESANSCKVRIQLLSKTGSNLNMRRYFDDFYIIVTGKP